MNELTSEPLPALSIADIEKLTGIKLAVETDEQKVIRLLRGGFEETIGISFDRFCEIRQHLIDDYPEKLI